jgi:hypothetical protein
VLSKNFDIFAFMTTPFNKKNKSIYRDKRGGISQGTSIKRMGSLVGVRVNTEPLRGSLKVYTPLMHPDALVKQ